MTESAKEMGGITMRAAAALRRTRGRSRLLAAALLLCAAVDRPIAVAELEPPATPQFFQDVAWSPDGTWIAFSRYGGGEEYDPARWEVAVSRPDGTEARVVARHAQWVTWSPDGERLAYSSPREGSWDLYVVDPGGGEPERLTSDDSDERAPSWSPEGREIAFTSNRDGNSEIYVLDLGSMETRRVTHDPADDHNPAWSPDGTELVFYRVREGGSADQVYRISADASAERPLTDDPHLNIFPSVLADGRVALARKHHDTGEKRIVLLGTDGSETLVGPAGPFFARWSPDGSRVLFIAGDWPQAAVYVMNAEGGEVRKVLN